MKLVYSPSKKCIQVAQSLCGEDHIVKGVSVHVSNAAPKTDPTRQHAGFPRVPVQGRDKGQSPFGPQPPYGNGGAMGVGGGGGQGWNTGIYTIFKVSFNFTRFNRFGLYLRNFKILLITLKFALLNIAIPSLPKEWKTLCKKIVSIRSRLHRFIFIVLGAFLLLLHISTFRITMKTLRVAIHFKN